MWLLEAVVRWIELELVVVGNGNVSVRNGFSCTTGQYFKKAMVTDWELVYRVEIWRRNRRDSVSKR